MVSISAGFVSSLVVQFLNAARDHKEFAPRLMTSRVGFCVAWACKDRNLRETSAALEKVFKGEDCGVMRYTFSPVAVNVVQGFPVEVTTAGTSNWEMQSSVAMVFGVIYGCPPVADSSDISAALTQIEGLDGAHLPFVEAVGREVVMYDLSHIGPVVGVPS